MLSLHRFFNPRFYDNLPGGGRPGVTGYLDEHVVNVDGDIQQQIGEEVRRAFQYANHIQGIGQRRVILRDLFSEFGYPFLDRRSIV